MKRYSILIILLTISIVTSSFVIADRVKVESANKSVSIILDYREFEELAKQSNNDLQWWFEQFKKLGIEYVGMMEENIERLDDQNKPLEHMIGKNALRNIYLNKPEYSALAEYNKERVIGDYDLVVHTTSEETFGFIKSGLEGRYSKEKYDFVIGEDRFFIILKGTIGEALYIDRLHLKNEEGKAYAAGTAFESSKLIRVGLGFDENKIRSIEDSGLKPFLRPFSYINWVEQKYLEAVIKDLNNKIAPPIFMFAGSDVLGYPNNLDIIKGYMLQNDIKLGMIETPVQRGHIDQRGLNLLARSLNYNTVRVFSILPWMQERFQYANYAGAEEIENMMYRAVTERNIRAVYFRPFKKNKIEYVTDFNEYEKMFERFERRIMPHGLTLGESSTMDPIRVRLIKQVLIAWGVLAAGIFLLSYLLKLKTLLTYGLLIIGVLTVPGGYLLRPELMEKVVALGAAIVFPSLGMLYFCHSCYKNYTSITRENLSTKIILAIRDLVIVSAISGIGALFVAAILSNIEFLLEMDIFRGVKFSQLMPIIIYGIIYFAYFGYNSCNTESKAPKVKATDVKALLQDNIKIFHVIVGSILLITGYIYIARTGHETNIRPSEFELILRNILEENLIARPRTKEFLIAFPILMTGIFIAKEKYKGLIFLSGLAAVIGQTSIVNTFSHLRTPIYLSAVRTIYSLGIGILFGIVYILIFIALMETFGRIKKIKIYE